MLAMASIRLRYQTIEFGDVDIHGRSLRDTQQFPGADGDTITDGVPSSNWPLFGVVWESSRRLARLMVDYEINGKRILEVGCGIGLASLVLNQRSADITATDYNPEAERFLAANVALNGGPPIPFVCADWADECGELGTFDLIVGSDLLYERGHAESLSAFVNRHANPHCEVVVVDPGRGQLARFGKHMVSYGYEDVLIPQEVADDGFEPFAGQAHCYRR